MRIALAVAAGVIPWIPAAPPPTPHPPLAPACRAAQLQVVSVNVEGATGSLAGGVNLRNAGAPCSLAGRPKLTFDSSAPVAPRTWLPFHNIRPGLPWTFSLRAIPTGAQVGFSFWWSNWCAPEPPGMLVGLPHDGGVVRATFHGTPRCDSAIEASTISATAFVQDPPQPSAKTHLPFAIAFTQGAYAVRAGSVLRFELTMRNTSGKPFRFGKCPAYVESLVNTTTINEAHVLNCRPAATIAPGASRVFAMRMRVPRRAAGENWELSFELGPDTYKPDGASPHPNPIVAVS
jgi:hypothetical protein